MFATALLENRSPMIFGDGEQTRDFTYVANVVDGVLRAAEAPGASGEMINVATGGRISFKQLFTPCGTSIGATVEPTYAGRPRRRRARLAGGHRQGAGGCSATSRLVTFEEGLRRTVDGIAPSRRRRPPREQPRDRTNAGGCCLAGWR